jgi:hypothetical protein
MLALADNPPRALIPVLVLGLGLAPIAARATAPTVEREGPPEPMSAEQEPPTVVIAPELVRNIELQAWGHVFLALGTSFAIAGTVLVEADGQGGVGKAGFAGIGGGLAVMVTGMFLLGFSRPVHLEETPGIHVVAAPASRGQGAVLTYDRYF